MPAWLEKKLRRTARRKGYKGKRFKRYVYGTLSKWKRKHK